MDLNTRTCVNSGEVGSASQDLKNQKLPMNVFFLVSRAEHARMWRRILYLKPYFQESFVAAFERTGLPVNHSHPYLLLGRFSHSKFLGRIPIMVRSFMACIKPVRESSVCYAFSLDLLLFLYIVKSITFSRTKLVYEVADIHHYTSASNNCGRVLRFVERFLIRRCCGVVLTSLAFRTGYFSDVQRFVDFPSVVIEHKVALPESVRNDIKFRNPIDSTLIIGYLGEMRSPASFSLLTRLANAAQGRIKVHFHGRFITPFDSEECLRIIDSSPFLEYFGPYKSPDELEQVYTKMDMVWDAYYEGDNARWQRTTRFNEACFFKRPLIYNIETQDGCMAERYGLGLAMSFEDPETFIKNALMIGESNLREWFENFNILPRDLVFYGREYDELVKMISGS